MLQFSQFVWPLRYSVWDVFNNFLLIDATDRSKISIDQKRFFIALSLYPLSFFVNTPFNVNLNSSFDSQKWAFKVNLNFSFDSQNWTFNVNLHSSFDSQNWAFKVNLNLSFDSQNWAFKANLNSSFDSQNWVFNVNLNLKEVFIFPNILP